MDAQQIRARISAGENERTEFKRSLDLKAVGRTVSAFANSAGGLLLLGVGDDGTPRGVASDPDTVAERLTSFLQSGLSAPVQARIGVCELDGACVHWIDVPRQRGFEPLRAGGAVFVRRGRASVEPGGPELAELYNMFGYVITEERVLDATTARDIDVHAFDDYLTRLGLSRTDEPALELDDDLRVRGVLAPLGDDLRATLYGVMAFGRTPQAYAQTRNFFVECVSYSGTDRATDVLEVAAARGRLDEQIDRALGWIAGQRRTERYDGAIRTDVPLLPVRAAREVIVNAVAHRDYAIVGSKVLVERFADRVEVTSPGHLPNGITPVSVERGGNPRARNQSMTNYLLTMGRMEQRGRGWPIIAASMSEHNGSTPRLEEDREARWVRVTLTT